MLRNISAKLIIGYALVAIGAYLLLVLCYPFLWSFVARFTYDSSVENITTSAAQEPWIVIPSLHLAEKIHVGSDESLLDEGVWMKFSERSNPAVGGNMVIVGHRFNFGLTPNETKRQSPFYDIQKLRVGDEITIGWQGKSFTYTVVEKKTVTPQSVEIEHDTSIPRLTLYTCTLGGEYDGREVVIAEPM